MKLYPLGLLYNIREVVAAALAQHTCSMQVVVAMLSPSTVAWPWVQGLLGFQVLLGFGLLLLGMGSQAWRHDSFSSPALPAMLRNLMAKCSHTASLCAFRRWYVGLLCLQILLRTSLGCELASRGLVGHVGRPAVVRQSCRHTCSAKGNASCLGRCHVGCFETWGTKSVHNSHRLDNPSHKP